MSIDQQTLAEYRFTTVDNARYNNLYMYSQENWLQFSDLYLANRCNIINDITSTEIPKITLNNDNASTLNMIHNLLNEEEMSETVCQTLRFFLKRLEVTKRIYQSYPATSVTPEIEIIDYCKLSYLFARHFNFDKLLKVANCLLKLNDRLIYHRDHWVTTSSEAFVYYSLVREQELIKMIQEQCS